MHGQNHTQLSISNAARSAYMELNLHVMYIWQSEVQIWVWHVILQRNGWIQNENHQYLYLW